jgi:UDP-N-acetylmuramate--alanine ligase
MIGIGGTGLSAIARVLLESGYRVSGSDRQLSPLALSLREAGVRVTIGHQADAVHGAELVLRSSAISDMNPEVVEALRLGIPVVKRAEFLAEMMENRIGIAVAGTHGKTTTTAMAAWVLSALRKDPTFIIGGVSANLGVNARAGKGPYFVIEADEYDRMFHGLKPAISIITNIEHDHPDCFPTPEDFFQAFVVFAERLGPEGRLIICGDDAGAARLAQELISRPVPFGVFTYGLDGSRDYLGREARPNNLGGYSFQLVVNGQPAGLVELKVPGLHNVRNALAVLAVGHAIGLSIEEMAWALGAFRGTGRRFEIRGEAAGVTVIDDYGHHPTEIKATLAAARARYPGRKIWAVWQPHTYSRTLALFDDFTTAFGDADHVVVTEIYASREKAPGGGYSSRSIVKAMQAAEAVYAATLDEAASLLVKSMKRGDVMIVFSAGDADQISNNVLEGLRTKEQAHV